MRSNMFVMLFVLMAGLLSTLGCVAGNTDDGLVKYVSPSGGADFVVDTDKGEIRYSSTDVVMAAKFCPRDSSYYCIDSAAFHFAVPRHLDATSKAWEVNSHKYTINSPLTQESIFGNQMDVAVITCQETEKSGAVGTMYYYYSPDRGLLVYELVVQWKNSKPESPMSNAPVVSILSTENGLGAKLSDGRQ